MDYAIVVILLLFSALFSGLTLGLMGTKLDELKRKKELGDAQASSVYRVRITGNLLLTTLLVGNVAVNAVLSIFLGSLTSGVLAAVIATVLIVFFGEIVPQAIFHRYALYLGSKLSWPVQFLIWALYPIAKPIAWTLDTVLGKELPSIYSKSELVKIIEDHEDDPLSAVDQDEERIVKGALTFSDKTIAQIMTPLENVIGFDGERLIDESLQREVRESSKTRFPVYGEKGIPHAMLFSAQLIGNGDLGKKINDIATTDVVKVLETDKLDSLLQKFLKTERHMFVVFNREVEFVGVVTLKDVLEEIIKTEIVDNEDAEVISSA